MSVFFVSLVVISILLLLWLIYDVYKNRGFSRQDALAALAMIASTIGWVVALQQQPSENLTDPPTPTITTDAISPTETPNSEPLPVLEVETASAPSFLDCTPGQIAYASNDGNIYLININEPTTKVNLTPHTSEAAINLSWSPDGQYLAYESLSVIYIIDARGEELNQLDTQGLPAGAPMWSPNGTQIAFSSKESIYLVNADGSGALERLTDDNGRDLRLSWSSDGGRIAYQTNRGPNSWNIDIVNVVTKERTQLDGELGIESYPSWSPNQDIIIFSAGGGRYAQPGIYRMSSSGDNITLITNIDQIPDFEDGDSFASSSWSPDGSQIVFEVLYGNVDRRGLFIISADGTSLNNLNIFDVNQAPLAPQWRPCNTS